MFRFLNISVLAKLYPTFSCQKKLLIITHYVKEISKFPHMLLETFMIIKRVRLFHFEEMLLNEDEVQRSSD